MGIQYILASGGETEMTPAPADPGSEADLNPASHRRAYLASIASGIVIAGSGGLAAATTETVYAAGSPDRHSEPVVERSAAQAYPTDVGRGIVRVDPTVFDSLEIERGDTVHVGSHPMPAVCLRLDTTDWDERIVRMDATLRHNTAVDRGDTVTISPATSRPAEHVTVVHRADEGDDRTPTPAELKFALASRPLATDLVVMLGVPEPPPLAGGSDRPFVPMVIATTRPETTVHLTEKTRIRLVPARGAGAELDDDQEHTADPTTDPQATVRKPLLNAPIAR